MYTLGNCFMHVPKVGFLEELTAASKDYISATFSVF